MINQGPQLAASNKKATRSFHAEEARSRDAGRLSWGSAIRFFGVAPSPLRPVLFFLPIDAGVLTICHAAGTPIRTFIVTLAAGFLAWSLAEYLLHRFLFHARPRQTWLRALLDRLHHHHHRHPYDLPSVALPLWFMIGFSIAAVLVLLLLIDSWTVALLLYTGFGVGYLCYEVTHYLTHRALLRNQVWPPWASPHLSHHFSYAGAHFGVTTTIWDRVFQTYAKPDRQRGGRIRPGDSAPTFQQ